MIEIKKDGVYIFETPHGSIATAHLRTRRDYSHMARRIIEGPFEDVIQGDKVVISASRLATVRMSEILNALSGLVSVVVPPHRQ
jgi:hypothetical protein